ncbi:MAG: hypothetical protein LBG15_16460 [Dysgonamonadaceae bacterium]|jgi:type I restriction enzyme S subunit|nr:hypothetical protein [Dysgonamonadaceae bacterium]
MDYQYITIPDQISISEIEHNNYCLTPSKYSAFHPNANVNFEPLNSLVSESSSKKKIVKKERYFYSEIGDIEISTGEVDGKEFWGIDIPSENPKIVKQNDILLSTVRTYRGGIGFMCFNKKNSVCSPALTVIREVSPVITKEYLLSILRTPFFIEQIFGFQNKGMYPRLDKSAMKYILIPIPKRKEIIEYITILTKAIVNKEKLIKERHNSILKKIENELTSNQKSSQFKFDFPTLNELIETGRLDTHLYQKKFKETDFLIKNYSHGYQTIYDYGFALSRGQNLQVSNIGDSIYSTDYHPNFYTLMLPKFLSKYGTVDTVKYLGNPKDLKTLKKGDLIFGAEGFEKGRSIVIIEEKERTITNIHGITIQQEEHDVVKAVFIKCFLDYLRNKGIIDLFAVGGNGGSLAQKYWDYIPFPKFGRNKQLEIALLYHNDKIKYETTTCCNIETFIQIDNDYNKTAGIYELDKTAKLLKEKLNQAIDDIVNDKQVDITFDLSCTK